MASRNLSRNTAPCGPTPLVGWAVLTVAGYGELYVVAAAIMALGGLIVFRIRSVR